MSEWRVLLNGSNFLMEFEGQPTKLGWFSTRYVEASDARSAELAAVELIRLDAKLSGVLNDPSDPPMIHLDEIEENPAADLDRQDPGFAFYVDDD